MIRLNSEENKQFLKMYERSGMASYSAFIADCVLNKPLKVIEINKLNVWISLYVILDFN